MSLPEDVAPAWAVSEWFNTNEPLSLDRLRGRVVVLEAFQMLCPGCVAHGIPQALRIQAAFSGEELTVVGLHTVFEHHEAMTPVSLRAFLHEYRINFPVGVDQPGGDGPIPVTMARYQMRGTPTLLVFDKVGRLRQHLFGAHDDLRLGAVIAGLLAEST